MKHTAHRPCRAPGRGARGALLGLGLCACSEPLAPEGERDALPHLFLWAWERPEDLRALGAASVGVAPLVATITLRAGEVEVRPRMQPLRLPARAAVLPVVRIEVSRAEPPLLDEALREQVVAALAGIAERGRGGEPARLQVDFESTASQRAFHRALLEALRARLGPRAFVGMTALASWCLGDRWLAGLPVDEVAPMLYRLGPRGREAEELLGERGDFPAPECRGALGLSLDEPRRLPQRLPGPARRTYLFNPRPWSATQLATAAAAPPGLPPSSLLLPEPRP